MKNSSPPNSSPQIPDHELIRCIGQGNYGEVWLAQNITLRTYRAVKIVYRSNFKEARPYDREFRGMQKFEPISRGHPGLVDILHVGRNDEAGYFYYVMELADDEVPDRPFDPQTYSAKTLGKEIAARRRLSAMESLEIGRGLANALAHMHTQGLVHRDVKPSNIIFVNGEPKLADIGLVMSLSDERSYVGTEGYIPLEGAGTIQADIFSLGKVLYEMSTGQDRTWFPKLPEDIDQFPDMEHVMELNEVVTRACDNLPGARYASASDLRSEIDLILAGRSVTHLRFVERQLSRVKRLAVAAGVLAVLALGFIVTLNYLRARQRHLLARAYESDAAQSLDAGNLHEALPASIEALRLERNDSAALETHRTRLGSLLQQSPSLLQFWRMDRKLSDVRFHPDGKRLLVAGGQRAQLLDIETGAVQKEFPTEHSIETAAFSPDGNSIALVHSKFLSVVAVATGASSFSFEANGPILSAEFSPDGEMALVTTSGRARLLNAHSGEVVGEDFRSGRSGPLRYAAFSPDGSMIVTAGSDGTASLFDVKTRQTILPPLQHVEWLPPGRNVPPVFAVAFSPDGQHVATGGTDEMIRIWSVADGRPLSTRMEHRGQVRRVSFSPDGRFIVSVGLNGTVHFWNSHTGRSEAMIDLHTSAMQAVFDSDARRVAIVGFAGEVRVWHLTPPAPVNVGRAAISGNGERYVTFSANEFRVWNASNDMALTPPRDAGGIIVTGICNWTAERVVVRVPSEQPDSELVRVFDSKGATLPEFAVPNPGRRWWLNAEGTRLLTGSGNDIHLWDTDRGKEIPGPQHYSATVQMAAFSPSGKILAVAIGTNVLVLNPINGQELLPPLANSQKIKSMAFSEDSKQLVIGGGDGPLAPGFAQILNLGTGKSMGVPIQHADAINMVSLSSKGDFIATASDDHHARIWIAATGEPKIKALLFPAQAHTARFSANNRWLLTATFYEAQVWDTQSGHAVTPRFTDPSVFGGAGFCAGGQRLWVQSRRGLLFWNLPRENWEPDELLALADHLGITIEGKVRRTHTPEAVENLRRYCVEARKRTSDVDAWQRAQAELCEANGDWFAAQFHLGRLLQKHPEDSALRLHFEKIRARFEAGGSAVVRKEILK